MSIFLLWSCLNIVFKHDCGPSSLSLINLASFSYVFMLHWLVYKLCNVLNFSCAIRVIDRHGVLTLDLLTFVAMEKFGNVVVNMVFRTRWKHCLCLYAFLSCAYTPASRTHIKFLFLIKLIKPQVKNFRRHCWIIGSSIYSQPSPWG
jgi:hypothetical protein